MTEPGRVEWKEPHSGKCAACGRRGPLVRHHVIYEQHVRREGGNPWDLRNALELGRYCRCHANHHARVQVLEMDLLPDAALAFAIELMGELRAALYLARYYSTTGGPAHADRKHSGPRS